MPQVALSSDFLEAFARIPRKKQKQVRESLEKFKREKDLRDSTSLNYERLAMRDSKVHSVRCGIDYRAIVISPPKGEVHLFVWVDHHDEAYRWAENKRFEVNQHTGTLQVYDVEQANAASSLPSESAREVTSVDADVIPPGRLFSGFDDTTLLLFGVPEPLLVAVRTVHTEGELDRLAPHLPPEAADALYLLAAGYTPEDTIDQLDRKKPAPIEKPEFDPDDFDAALQRPGTQQQFKLVETEHELAEILNAPLERWRIFLHPSQQKLVTMNSGGPARVLGSAGTGKTVVAVHRARYLAEKCPPGKKVLFTTFTTNLAADIQALLESLAPSEMVRIEVTNLHAWARGLLQARGVKVKTTMEQPRAEEAGWLEAYPTDEHQTFPKDFYADEWKEVVQPQGVLTEEDYLRARRAGRGTRLSRDQRKQVWKVLSAYRRYLQSQGLMDPADLIREAFLLREELLGGRQLGQPSRVDTLQDGLREKLCISGFSSLLPHLGCVAMKFTIGEPVLPDKPEIDPTSAWRNLSSLAKGILAQREHQIALRMRGKAQRAETIADPAERHALVTPLSPILRQQHVFVEREECRQRVMHPSKIAVRKSGKLPKALLLSRRGNLEWREARMQRLYHPGHAVLLLE